MKNLLYLFFALIFVACSSDDSTDLASIPLKGKVKLFSEIDYVAITKFGSIIKGPIGPSETFFDKNRKNEYDRNGMLISSINYNRNNEVTSEYNYEYDRFGNWILESFFRKRDSLTMWGNSPEKKTRKEWKYDNNKNKVEMSEYDYESLKSKKTYKYDFDDNIIEENKYFSDGRLWSKSIYDYVGDNNVKIIDYNSKGQKSKEITNTFDNNGRIIEELTELISINTSYKTTYRYDKQSNVIENNQFGNLNTKVESKYDLSGRIKFKTTTFYKSANNDRKPTNINYNAYKYDSYGNIIENKLTYEDGRLIPVSYTTAYIYDNQQNWVKKISYKNFIAEKLTERELEYYN